MKKTKPKAKLRYNLTGTVKRIKMKKETINNPAAPTTTLYLAPPSLSSSQETSSSGLAASKEDAMIKGNVNNG